MQFTLEDVVKDFVLNEKQVDTLKQVIVLDLCYLIQIFVNIEVSWTYSFIMLKETIKLNIVHYCIIQKFIKNRLLIHTHGGIWLLKISDY